ncbi:Bacteriophage tail assembly protein [Campylobacter jejuni]|nr:Bacteriophage tail assembly protein [Campylobacter jejuni]
MTNYYSAATNGFYSSENKLLFKASDAWPIDAVAVTDDEYFQLLNGQSDGLIITADEDGHPVLTNPPELTLTELNAQATEKRDQLMTLAAAAIAPLQDAVDIRDATDAETALLNAWKKYRVALNRLDLSTAPEITWPEVPGDVA